MPDPQRESGELLGDLSDEEDLFTRAPELRYAPRVTVPLKAGDCTFHSGFTGHMALPNTTDQARFAHVNIYMDADTVYTGAPHPVTIQLDLTPGETFDHELFPQVRSQSS